MKKVITGVTPILLLVLALTFMTNYKQWDDLSDNERYQIRNYVEAAEAETPETGTADVREEEESEDDVASAKSIDEIEVDPNKSYAVTDDKGIVTVYDDQGNAVYEATTEEWQENQAEYYAKFGLGSY